MKIFHIGLPRTFLGVQSDWQGAKYVILSSPYDSTVSYGVGARNGPKAIIDASRQVELYDIELGKDISSECGIFTADELEVDRGSPQRNCKFVEEAVHAVLEAGKFPILLGGEHSVSVGAFNALAKFGKKNLSVLQIDAHADMRDEYEGSKYDHACAMARCRENFHAVSVGIRSYSSEEAEAIKKRKLDIYGSDFSADEVIGKLKEEVYVTIDLDGFDPSEAPAVGTPEPGGLSWKQVTSLLREVCRKRKVVGFDLVELSPIPGNSVSDFLCARLVYKLIGYVQEGKK
ncbi:MAG: agmatinase [Candidatus Micrarchaeota archaeon]|nr:agmatinase [Candidatus Micrarchaeota archaeon]